MASGSKATETKEAGKTLQVVVENLPETEVESAVHPVMGKPSISGLSLHNHNIL